MKTIKQFIAEWKKPDPAKAGAKKPPKGNPLTPDEDKSLVHVPGFGRVRPDQVEKLKNPKKE